MPRNKEDLWDLEQETGVLFTNKYRKAPFLLLEMFITSSLTSSDCYCCIRLTSGREVGIKGKWRRVE